MVNRFNPERIFPVFLRWLIFVSTGVLIFGFAYRTEPNVWDKQSPPLSYSSIVPQVIQLDLPRDLPPEDDGIGGLITVDVNDDGALDYVITKPGLIAAYDHSGRQLWSKRTSIQITRKSEAHGLPGSHAPGVQGADIDGDAKTEVLFLTRDNRVQIVAGNSGKIEASVYVAPPDGAERWEHLVIANFRGRGDRDLLLQATNATGYRMGRYLAAYSLTDLIVDESPTPLWTRDDFIANAHNGARIADLDGDGKDEILGGTIVGATGEVLLEIPLRGHIDSLFVADVRPDIPGLEVIALEEGPTDRLLAGDNPFVWRVNDFWNRLHSRNRIFLFNKEGVIWETHFKQQEPQNAAVGDFDPSRPGLEIWCRSRFNERQKPFVFDAGGELIDTYEMKNVAPEQWTIRGLEVIFTVAWTGEPKQLAAAKERHRAGDVAIFDPISGAFLHWFDESADRLYVSDVSGDWREELIVLSGDQLRIYSNAEPNPNPDHPELWSQAHYRRSKMTWNYYSP